MKIAVGADHRGRDVVQHITERLRAQGYKVTEHLPPEGQSGDYPDAAWSVAHSVSTGAAQMGILICGTGVGMCIAANKMKGIRAAPVHDEVTAEISRAHVDANVLCLSADLLGLRLIDKIVDLWLRTPFEGGRHQRRVQKIESMEEGKDPTTLNRHH